MSHAYLIFMHTQNQNLCDKLYIQLIFRCDIDHLCTDLFCFNISTHWVPVYTAKWCIIEIPILSLRIMSSIRLARPHGHIKMLDPAACLWAIQLIFKVHKTDSKSNTKEPLLVCRSNTAQFGFRTKLSPASKTSTGMKRDSCSKFIVFKKGFPHCYFAG